MPYLSVLQSENLWLFGGRDRHIPVKLSLERIDKMSDDGLPFHAQVYPHGDHLLLDRREFPPFQNEMRPRLAEWFGAERH